MKKADNTIVPVEWDGQSSIMLGNLQNDKVKRMDGTRCTPEKIRAADPARLEEFALTGKWEFPFITEAEDKKFVGVIDMTPTWSGILPLGANWKHQ